jgi:TolB-like protein/Tfp pilus assembly protein PilF
MHEAMLTSLASLEGLLVTSTASVHPYADTLVPPARVARELGVKHVVMGSVQRAGKRIRVTARLVEAETGRQLWARQFERPYSVDDLFGIQSRVALATARALDVRLSSADTRRLARRLTGSIDAYDFYLRGRERLGFVVGQGATDRRQIERSIGLFREALARDPEFARPHVGLARAYAELAAMEADGPWRDSVRTAARRALELAPGLPDAHLAMAEVHRSGHAPGDLAAYHREIRRALELSPGHPRATLEAARGWWRAALEGSSRLDQVYCWADRAARLEPSNPELLRARAFGALAIGRYETAEEAARAAVELEPDGMRIYRTLVRTALLRSDRDGAEAHYRTARTVSSSSDSDLAALGIMEAHLGLMDSARVHLDSVSEHLLGRFSQEEITLAHALRRTGRTDRAASILAAREEREREALRRGTAGFYPAVNLARVHAVRGETEAAVEAMRKAVNRGWRHVARIGPELDGPLHALWGHPGFDALMRQVWTSVDSMRRVAGQKGCDALRELPEARAR